MVNENAEGKKSTGEGGNTDDGGTTKLPHSDGPLKVKPVDPPDNDRENTSEESRAVRVRPTAEDDVMEENVEEP